MIQLKADATIKAAFNKTINVMGADIEWLEIIVIKNNNIILPGKRRSLVFSFDNRKVVNTIVDMDFNVDNARLMCNNALLENAFNVLLYIFGKWNQIKGLTVNQNYKQLKKILDNVFSEINVTAELEKDKCRFYSNGILLVYEDVIQLILDKMRNVKPTIKNGRDEDIDKEDKDIEEVVEKNEKDADTSKRKKMGLWHNMVWKKDKKSFKYSELSKKERDRKRLGKGFYASPYKCPICAGVLYMTVYPQGTEKKIETDEGNVYLARAYTCNECTVFFTPRPDLLLAEGDIYKLDFDGDEEAYEDYIDVMGKAGRRVSNCNFNVYEADYEPMTPEQVEQEEQEREQLDKRMLSEVCDDIKSHPDAEIFQLNARMDADFYSNKNSKKYGPVIEKETKRRNLLSGDIKKFFKKHFELDSMIKYGKKKKKRHRNYSDVENDISADDNTIKVADGVNNIDSKANSNVEKIGHSDISENNSKINNSDSNDNDVQTEKDVKKRANNKKHLTQTALKGDDKKFITDIAKMSEKEIKNFGEDIVNDSALDDNFKKKYKTLSDKMLEKKQEKDIAQKIVSVKEAGYNEMVQAYKDISKKDCVDKIKKPFLQTLFNWLNGKRKKELEELTKEIPQRITRKQYNEYKEKIKGYSNNSLYNMLSDNDSSYEAMKSNIGNNKEDISLVYENKLDQLWKNSQINDIKNIINNVDNSIRDIYDVLLNGDYDSDVSEPFINKYHDKLKKQDTIAIEQICPDLAKLSFDEAVDAYEKISQEPFLPELKVDILGKITDHLEELKKEECKSLIEKFAKDMDYNDSYDNLYMCKLDDDEEYAVDNAMSSYAGLNQFEYPITVCDTSRTSNGKKGFVLTPDNIYYSQGLSSGVLNVRDINDIYIEKGLLSKGVFVNYAGVGKVKISSIPKFSSGEQMVQHFVSSLKDFIEYLKEKPISRSIEYLAKEEREVICCVRCGYIFDAEKGNVCPKCGNINEV